MDYSKQKILTDVDGVLLDWTSSFEAWLKEKEAKIKKYVQGGGSAFENGHVPDHPAGVQQHEDEDEKNAITHVIDSNILWFIVVCR